MALSKQVDLAYERRLLKRMEEDAPLFRVALLVSARKRKPWPSVSSSGLF
jgi:hypothetical protein